MTAGEIYVRCADIVGGYPVGMVDLGPKIPSLGRGFFPVASGSLHAAGATDSVRRKFLVLGQDWGDVAALRELKGNADAEMESPTVRNLVGLFSRAGIPLEECFFSNVLMGVRQGHLRTGNSPGWGDGEFVLQCARALRELICAVDPEVIVCLGSQAPRLLKVLFPECEVWEKETFAEIDRRELAVIRPRLRRRSRVGRVTRLGLLLHPSLSATFRGKLIQKRFFNGMVGEEAEEELLRELSS